MLIDAKRSLGSNSPGYILHGTFWVDAVWDKHPRFPKDLTLGVFILVVYGIFFVCVKSRKGKAQFSTGTSEIGFLVLKLSSWEDKAPSSGAQDVRRVALRSETLGMGGEPAWWQLMLASLLIQSKFLLLIALLGWQSCGRRRPVLL